MVGVITLISILFAILSLVIFDVVVRYLATFVLYLCFIRAGLPHARPAASKRVDQEIAHQRLTDSASLVVIFKIQRTHHVAQSMASRDATACLVLYICSVSVKA